MPEGVGIGEVAVLPPEPARQDRVGAVGVVIDQRDASLEVRRLRLHQVQHRLGDPEVAEEHDVRGRPRRRGRRGAAGRAGPAHEGPQEPPGDAVVAGDQIGREE